MKLKFLFAGALVFLLSSCAQQVCPTYTKNEVKQNKSKKEQVVIKETRV